MKEIILHIGTQKAGTSSLQQYFDDYKELLNDNGVAYPFSDKELDEILPGLALNQGFRYTIRKYDLKAVSAFEKYPIQKFVDRLESENAARVILSNEDLYYQKDLSFLEFLKDYNIRVVIYLRPRMELLDSIYRQDVEQHGEVSNFPVYLKEFGYWCSSRNTKEWLADEMDYGEILQRWSKAVGKENIIVRSYDRKLFRNGDVVADFLGLVNLDYLYNETLSYSTNQSMDSALSDNGTYRRINYFIVKTAAFLKYNARGEVRRYVMLLRPIYRLLKNYLEIISKRLVGEKKAGTSKCAGDIKELDSIVKYYNEKNK
jgi:hypothetical protein